MDLNILLNSTDEHNEDVINLIKRAYDFGYECVALNTFLDSSKLTGKKITIPEPKYIHLKFEPGRKFRILNRLTAVITDGLHIHHLLSAPVIKKYDILAFQPVGEAMLRKCHELEVDIISLNLSEELGFNMKRTHVGPLISRGKCLEITYAPCLRDSFKRRMTISNAQILVEACKSKNLIICSGATKPLELRAVEDVQNLGLLFGFERNTAVDAVRKNGQLAILHAETRTKTGCGFVSLTQIINLPKHQGWIIDACKVPSLPKSENSVDNDSETLQQKPSKKLKVNE